MGAYALPGNDLSVAGGHCDSESSWETLVSVSQGVVIVVVVLTPWLPVLALIGMAIWLGIRRMNKRRVIPNQVA